MLVEKSLIWFKILKFQLMGKLAFYLGEDMIEKYFLDKFIRFCSDDSVYTRELCATNFGNICEELGTETTEKKLVRFLIILLYT